LQNLYDKVYLLRLDKYTLCFEYDTHLIDFIFELNRPFVFSDCKESLYVIRFVYGTKNG